MLWCRQPCLLNGYNVRVVRTKGNCVMEPVGCLKQLTIMWIFNNGYRILQCAKIIFKQYLIWKKLKKIIFLLFHHTKSLIIIYKLVCALLILHLNIDPIPKSRYFVTQIYCSNDLRLSQSFLDSKIERWFKIACSELELVRSIMRNLFLITKVFNLWKQKKKYTQK